MRVVVFVKADADSEAGIMPSTELLEQMGKYNEELVGRNPQPRAGKERRAVGPGACRAPALSRLPPPCGEGSRVGVCAG